jgi:hypothetical protein
MLVGGPFWFLSLYWKNESGEDSMVEVVSKCGMNCGECPWSPITRKDLAPEDFPAFAKRAKKILGYTPTKKPCLLCLTPEDKIPKDTKHWHSNFRRGCRIRQCVTRMGIKNCAYCSRFPCDFEIQHAGTWDRETFEKRMGEPMSDEDYRTFVEPFEGVKRLQKIRSTLSPDQIVEAIVEEPLKLKVVDFPESLPYPSGEIEGFKAVLTLLAGVKRSSLGLKDTDILPQQHRLKSRISHLIRFLWIFARYGKFKAENGGHLVVDPEVYLDNRGSARGLGNWSTVKEVVLKNLERFGVHGELVELAEGWTTPTMSFRNQGWEMKLSFDDIIGGTATLKALRDFAMKLDAKYGKRAHRYFKDADMRVLSET